MSRIDELKEALHSRQAYLRDIKSIVSGTEDLIEKVKEEIAELEAHKMKPIELEIWLGSNGGASFIPFNGWDKAIFIQKIPVKVTREMVRNLISASAHGDFNSQEYWAKVITVAGIDAEPSND